MRPRSKLANLWLMANFGESACLLKQEMTFFDEILQKAPCRRKSLLKEGISRRVFHSSKQADSPKLTLLVNRLFMLPASFASRENKLKSCTFRRVYQQCQSWP
jgi:hypothetical protein